MKNSMISLLGWFFVILTQWGFAQNSLPFYSIHYQDWTRFKTVISPEPNPVLKNVPPPPLKPRNVQLTKEVFGYLPYWRYNSYPSLNYNLLTTIAYFGAELDGNGNITALHHWPANGLITMAHNNGVRVVLTAILFDSNDLATLLSSATNRTRAITNLLNQVKNANADGVTIDFEGVPSGQRENLTAFMDELTATFHREIPGSFVTIFTPAVDWRNVFDYYQLAPINDGIIMQGYDYHWSGSSIAGPVAPLTGWGTYNVTWTVNDYLTKTFNNYEKLILSVPFYGIEWPTVSGSKGANTRGNGSSVFYSEAASLAQQYGKLWDTESQTPWYRYQNTDGWYQGWFDDSLSLALKFNLVNDDQLKGIAIWALSYDGQRTELQAAISDAFGSTAPPLKPTEFRVVNVGDSTLRIQIKAAAGATRYRLYMGTHPAQLMQTIEFATTSVELADLSPDSVYYFRVSALNSNGESTLTEMLAALPSISPASVLIVHGFDRTSNTVNQFDYIKRFAPSIARYGLAFDACANEAIESSAIDLKDYPIVIWILGEEGTADESFSGVEQQKVAAFLENGGKLFVSGSEIGYDLVAKGSNTDKTFYRTYLKAEYVRDRVATYRMNPTANGIFQGLSPISFDDGTHGTYNVDYPDGIRPVDGAQWNLIYNGYNANTYGGAGIQYVGTFGQGTHTGQLVYLAVGFETIYPEAMRDSVMAHILDFFSDPTGIEKPLTVGTTSLTFQLHPNYPNPFNPGTTIPVSIYQQLPTPVRLEIFDVMGKKIRTLVNQILPPGNYRFQWNGRDDAGQAVSAGTYFIRLQVGHRQQVYRAVLVR